MFETCEKKQTEPVHFGLACKLNRVRFSQPKYACCVNRENTGCVEMINTRRPVNSTVTMQRNALFSLVTALKRMTYGASIYYTRSQPQQANG